MLGGKGADVKSVKSSLGLCSEVASTQSEKSTFADNMDLTPNACDNDSADHLRKGIEIVGQADVVDVVRDLGHVPVPADGLCLSHTAVAAKNVEAWMVSRDKHGWRRDADLERQDTMEAKAMLDRIIRLCANKVVQREQDKYHFIEAVRLQMPGPVGYAGIDQLQHFADELVGKIEMVDLDQPQHPMTTFGSDGTLLYRVGHILHRGADGAMADHWVLVKSHIQKAGSPPVQPRGNPMELEVRLPVVGDKILILQEQWLERILSLGDQTHAAASRSLRPWLQRKSPWNRPDLASCCH